MMVMPLSQLPMLHESVTEGIEVCCLLWFMANLLMKRLFKGRATFWHNRANPVKILLLLTALIDAVIFLCGRWLVACSFPVNYCSFLCFFVVVVAAVAFNRTKVLSFFLDRPCLVLDSCAVDEGVSVRCYFWTHFLYPRRASRNSW